MKETEIRARVWEAKGMVGEARDQAFDIWEKVYGDKIIVFFLSIGSFVTWDICNIGISIGYRMIKVFSLIDRLAVTIKRS